MSINFQKRMTTGPKTAFVSCMNLPQQERDITMQEARMINGGNGKAVGHIMKQSANSYTEDLQRKQYMGNAGPGSGRVFRGNTGLSSTPEEIRANSLYGKIGDAADALGDAASECWDSVTDYATDCADKLCDPRTWQSVGRTS